MKKPSTGRRRRAAAAFTLIELMVATGILAILVLMVGGLFSQASSVWDAGYVRAEGGMVARAIVGSIQRDLQSAVDGRAFDGLGFSSPVEASGSSIKMVVLSAVDPREENDRGLRLVEYTINANLVKRKESLVVADSVDNATGRAKWETKQKDSPTQGGEIEIYNGSEDGGSSSSFTVKAIRPDYGEGEKTEERKDFETDQSEFAEHVAWGESGKSKEKCPTWCRIRVEIVPTGSTTGLEVRSNGGGKGEIVSR